MMHPQPHSSQPSKRHDLLSQRHRHLSPTWHTALIVMIFAFLGLSLSGCDSLWDLIHTDGDAEAQIFANENQRVRTFVIETNSFSIETNNDEDQAPSVMVGDSVTEYTMNSDGIVRFSESGGGSDQRFDIESGDRIIERPGASGTGTLTIIDESPAVSPSIQ